MSSTIWRCPLKEVSLKFVNYCQGTEFTLYIHYTIHTFYRSSLRYVILFLVTIKYRLFRKRFILSQFTYLLPSIVDNSLSSNVGIISAPIPHGLDCLEKLTYVYLQSLQCKRRAPTGFEICNRCKIVFFTLIKKKLILYVADH